MLWTVLAFLTGVSAGIAIVGVTLVRRRVRRRPVRRIPQGSEGAYGDAGALQGLSARERSHFLTATRADTQAQRDRWDRDYPGAGTSLPGRLPGIPRALRVRN